MAPVSIDLSTGQIDVNPDINGTSHDMLTLNNAKAAEPDLCSCRSV